MQSTRGDENPHTIARDESRNVLIGEDGNPIYLDYLEASGFYKFIKFKMDSTDKELVTPELVIEWRDEYLGQHPFANQHAKDYSTKKPLFDDFWKIFMENELYKRLDLITFH